MKEKPILFSSAMVKAILDGRKTQTRRVVNLNVLTPTQIKLGWKSYPHLARCDYPVKNVPRVSVPWRHPTGDGCLADEDLGCATLYAPIWVGTRLWVRETWAAPWGKAREIFYRADGADRRDDGPWRPSIHMPRWASRITLEVTEVRVQRLQEISEEDAKAEGIETVRDEWSGKCGDFDETLTDKQLFQILWDSINRKKHPWASNPWVWCISFSAIKP